jgi:hypothetical protein
MSVRKTESRLPLDYLRVPGSPTSPISADCLGQASETSATTGKYILISYLSSPIMANSRNDYVLFATEGANADKYLWTVELEEKGKIITDQPTDYGIFSWIPIDSGEYTITVKIQDGTDIKPKEATMHQTVLPNKSDSDLIGLLKLLLTPDAEEEGVTTIGAEPLAVAVSKIADQLAILGHSETAREILYDFWGYIFEGADATGPNGIPPRFLAAILYDKIECRPKDFSTMRPELVATYVRSTQIDDATIDLIEPESFHFIIQLDNGLGVGQVKSSTAAMILGIKPWVELSIDKEERIKQALKMDNDFKKDFTETQKIDIFNLLRFPKTNIAVTAALLARLKNRMHRWPAETQQQFLKDQNALQIISTEFNTGAINSPRESTKPDSSGPKILKCMQSVFLSTFFPEHQNTSLLDSRAADFENNLRNALKELGFVLAGSTAPLQWAVREFQIYSRMEFIARELKSPPVSANQTNRLRTCSNLYRYGGPISGDPNPETLKRIHAWQACRWRCPVVVSAWNMKPGEPNVRDSLFNPDGKISDNIWLHKEVPRNEPRMFAQDYTGYFQIPNIRIDGGSDSLRNGFVVLGEYIDYPKDTKIYGGPVSRAPDHTWPESELMPVNFAGVESATMTPEQKSTFKVVRAVSEAECMGYFDSLNAYDNAFISLGPCHWTLGIKLSQPEVAKGELCAFFAYLDTVEKATYNRILRNFGIQIDTEWANTACPDEQKYTAWLKVQKDDYSLDNLPRTEQDGNYFHTWHWFYRFVMAARTLEPFRLRMMDMARIRLRDIRAVPWPPILLPNGQMTDWSTIGEIYSSERACALVLRWHIKNPLSVVGRPRPGDNIQAGLDIQSALAKALAKPVFINYPEPDIRKWTDGHEGALIDGLLEQYNADHMDWVRDWPRWEGADNPNRYQLDPASIDPWFESWTEGSTSHKRRLKASRNSFLMWTI